MKHIVLGAELGPPGYKRYVSQSLFFSILKAFLLKFFRYRQWVVINLSKIVYVDYRHPIAEIVVRRKSHFAPEVILTGFTDDYIDALKHK